MADKLYPPLIAGSLPAFYKSYEASSRVVQESYITIPFTESAVVGAGDFVGFSLRMKTASTETYLFDPLFSASYDSENCSVTFALSASNAALLNEGQFYKVQLAYVSALNNTIINSDGTTDNTVTKLTGYYSTVGIIKCVSKPDVYIRGYSIDSINLFNNEMFGVYSIDPDLDRTEKVYSYNFTFYTEDNKIYYTTGEILHNTSEDDDYGSSIDRVVFNNFIENDKIYKMAYTVTTINGLVISSPYYRITAESLLAPSKSLDIIPIPDEDKGCIKVNLRGVDKIISAEDAIISLKRVARDYQWDNELYQRLKEFYWGQKKKPTTPKIKNWVDLILDGNQSYILGYLTDYRLYLKDNINLLSEIFTLTTGLLEFMIDESVIFCTDLGKEIEKLIDEPQNAVDNYDEYLSNILTTYILTTSEGYKNLVPSLQTRIDEYNNYVIDMARADLTSVNNYNTDLTFIATVQTIINTCDLGIEIGKIYLSLLNYVASIEHQENKLEETYFGQYILARASEEDGYTTWIELKRFKLENILPSLISYSDWTPKLGVRYMYSIQQYNIWGLYSSRIVSESVSIDFEDIFLYDGDCSLRVRYNPKISSFKTTLLEAKTNTIGSKFPYIFRNGKVEYKEFPLSGLISFLMDDEKLFYNESTEEEYYRLCTENKDRKNSQNFLAEMEKVLINPCDLVEENIRRERDFKADVLDWLNDGRPKLFRSGPEGNFIVRIMNVSMSPTDSLGRMLHTFTCQCVEIADFTYNNLLKYGFIQADSVSKYVSLWKTYYLNEYPSGLDIEVTFESNVSYFSVLDLMPGTNIYITYGDTLLKEEEVITIGITGSYTYSDAARPISKIRFPNIERHLVGILEVQYKGVRYSDFDAITSMKLKTILSNQYIGVNPDLVYIDELMISDSEKFKKTVKTLKYRTLLNEYNKPTDIYNMMLSEGFEPNDILQYINADFYHRLKNKIRISNLEQLRFRVRELIPIYAVPYDLINKEGWARMPEKVAYGTNSFYYKQQDGTYLKEQYTAVEFPAQSLLYSVTPFGMPYPIDELTPIVKEYYDINDEYCIFQMMEYKELNAKWANQEKTYYPQSFNELYPDEDYALENAAKYIKPGVWLPSERYNYIGVRTGKFYDCYWKNVVDDYDTSFYIDNRYRYDVLDFTETLIEEDEKGFYLKLGETKHYFGEFDPAQNITELELYIKYNGEYTLAKNLFVFPKNDGGFYTSLSNDDNRITEKEYLDTAIRWRDKDNYHSIDDYYNNSWTPDENKKAASIVRSAEVGPFYLREESLIKLLPGEVREYKNLTNPTVIRSGSGLIVEATFQLEILDYFTEENNLITKIAKDTYLNLSSFLANLYRDYEILADADNKFLKYLTLSRIYRTLIEGLNPDNNIPFEGINDYTSLETALINYQDRRIIQTILNADKGDQDLTKISELALLWSRNASTAEDREEAEESVKTLLKRLSFNKLTKEDLELIETEEEDLLNLITSLSKDGLAAKKTQIGEVLKTLAAQSAASQTEIAEVTEAYEKLLGELTLALTDCNVSIYKFHAKMWLYTLVLHYLRVKFAKDLTKPWNGFKTSTSDLQTIDNSITAELILAMIKEHYNNILAVIGDSTGTISDESAQYRGHYRDAWSNANSIKDDISVNQSIVDEKEGDSSLDEFLTNEIKAQLFNYFYQYYKAYICRRSLNKIFNETLVDSNTKKFKEYVEMITIESGKEVTTYNFDDLTDTLITLKDSLINEEGTLTFEDALYNYFIDYIDTTLKDEYNSYVQLLANRSNALTDEDTEAVIQFIKVYDTYCYVKQGINVKVTTDDKRAKAAWKCIVDSSFNSTTTQKVYDEDIATSALAKDLEARCKYVVDKTISTYMTKMSSSELNKILSLANRNIIYEYGDTSTVTTELDIFNSKEFDAATTTTAKKTARIAKINALLEMVDEQITHVTTEDKTHNNYLYLLDTYSDVTSESGGLITTFAKANTKIEEFNKLIQKCQKEVWTKARFDTYVEVTCKSVDHLGYQAGKYYVYNINTKKYVAVKSTTELDFERNTYYIKLRDMMIYDFLTYYNSLIITDEEKLAITADDVDEYLKSSGTVAQLDTFKLLTKFASYGGIGTTKIVASMLSEDFFYNKMITNIIGFSSKTSDVESALGKGTIATKLVAEVTNTASTSLYKSTFKDNILKYIENVLINPSSSEITYYQTCITNAKATTESTTKYLILNYVSWLGDLYYCYNVGVLDRAEMGHFKQEIFTKLKAGENDIITNDVEKESYGNLTKVGIIYWYLYSVLNTSVNDLSDLIKLANALAVLYDNKYDNYTAKLELYSNMYKEYLAIYTAYIGTDVFNYYNSSIDDKDVQMSNLIASIKDAWYEFVLALDAGYKQEIEAGMYQ